MSLNARPRDIWTRLTVDPLAAPLARRLAPLAGVTPNRITSVSLMLGVAAAACFTVGQLRWGGALFILRFFADCLDGMVARLQGSSSARGALLDIVADVMGVTLSFAALTWHLVSEEHLPLAVAPAVLGALVVYNWALAHRKHLADVAGRGDGGARHDWHVTTPVLRSWVDLCRRLNMSIVPWSVEAEILALGLAPLLLPASHVATVVIVILAFYVVADGVNIARLWRIAGLLDQRTAPTAPERAVHQEERA